jgi:hypothetical protein
MPPAFFTFSCFSDMVFRVCLGPALVVIQLSRASYTSGITGKNRHTLLIKMGSQPFAQAGLKPQSSSSLSPE